MYFNVKYYRYYGGNMKTEKSISSNIKMLIICAPLFVLAILLSTASILINTNGVISSYVYLVSFVGMISSLCDVFIYAASFAFIVKAIYKRAVAIVPFAIFVLLSALRYFISAVIGGVIRGAVNRNDMSSALLVLGMDVIITGILMLTAYGIHKRSDKKGNDHCNASSRRFLPDLSLPTNKAIFIAGIVWASIRVVSQLIYDVSYIIMIGAPSATNVVWMVIYYLCAILICPIFYVVSGFTLKLINKDQDKSF